MHHGCNQCVACAVNQDESHRAASLVVAVILNDNSVVCCILASLDDQHLAAQVSASILRKVTYLAQGQLNGEVLRHSPACGHGEHSIRVDWVALRYVCLGRRDPERQLVIVGNAGCGRLALLVQGIVCAAIQHGKGHRATRLGSAVILNLNAVENHVGAGGDGRLLGAQVAGSILRKVTHLAHRQHDRQGLCRRRAGSHHEHGMAVIALPYAWRHSSDAEGRLVVIHHAHAGLPLLVIDCVA